VSKWWWIELGRETRRVCARVRGEGYFILHLPRLMWHLLSVGQAAGGRAGVEKHTRASMALAPFVGAEKSSQRGNKSRDSSDCVSPFFVSAVSFGKYRERISERRPVSMNADDTSCPCAAPPPVNCRGDLRNWLCRFQLYYSPPLVLTPFSLYTELCAEYGRTEGESESVIWRYNIEGIPDWIFDLIPAFPLRLNVTVSHGRRPPSQIIYI
jgi:hypothetical protein